MVKILALLIGLAAAAMAAYSLYDALYGPAKVVLKYGTTSTRSDQAPGKTIKRRTRQVQRGSDKFWEVELPGGSWLDCAGDCADTYRREELDRWQTQKEETIR